MALKKWTTGDTITAVSANNKGNRKGTTSEIGAINAADLEVGDIFYNETEFVAQSLYAKSANKFTSYKTLLGAEGQEASIAGTTPTQVKDLDFIKDATGFTGNRIFIVARLKNSNGASSAHLRVRKNGGGTDELDLSTTSTSYTIVKGSFSISADSDGYITLEFFLDSGAAHTATVQLVEVYGV